MAFSSCAPDGRAYYRDGSVRQIRSAGEIAECVNVVLLGDGFTAAQLFEGCAYDAAAEKMAATLLATPPFSYYADRINVFVSYDVSADSGADTIPESDTSDTAFDSTFGYYGIDRLLVAQDSDAVWAAATRCVGSASLAHMVVVIVNDDRYGGSGGDIATASMVDGAELIVLHEVGHSFGSLADEYVDEAAAPAYEWPVPAAYPNVDMTSNAATIKWKDFLAYPEYSAVGAYEGGYYRATGVWRPEAESLMRSLGAPGFNAPSRAAIAKRIREILGLAWDLGEFIAMDIERKGYVYALPKRIGPELPMPVPRALYEPIAGARQ
jgi:hypothetical protein